MRPKGIAVLVGIAVVILIVVFLPVQQGDVPPSIVDKPMIQEEVMTEFENLDNLEIEEDLLIELSSGIGDVVNTTDTATIETETSIIYYENEAGVIYYIDENGLKHYVLSIEDLSEILDE